MLHSTRTGKPHSGANERLIGGRNLEKDLIVIREIRRTHYTLTFLHNKITY
jgi:hypothetical protein